MVDDKLDQSGSALVEMSSSPSSKRQSDKNVVNEETPPPSLPPSPPPSLSNAHAYSDWSIEIESLSEEPPPGIRPVKKVPENKRENVQRSNSWSRSLMNSFRRKKSKEYHVKNREDTSPGNPVVQKSENFNLENNTVSAEYCVPLPEPQEANRDRPSAVLDNPITVQPIASPTTETNPKSLPKGSRLLNFVTFGRRGPVPVPALSEPPEQTDKMNETSGVLEGQETQIVESGLKGKSERKSQKKIKREKNVKLKKETKVSDERTKMPLEESTNLNLEMATPSKSDGGQQEEGIQTANKPEENNTEQSPTCDPGSDQPDQIAAAAISIESCPIEAQVNNPVRQKWTNFFKREKAMKFNKTDQQASSTTDATTSTKKEDMKLRKSFRGMKTKSVDLDAVAKESKRKHSRPSSTIFGSSFSLKRVFQNDASQPAEDSTEDEKVKRNTIKSKSRSKSVEIEKNTTRPFERFVSFTRESLKKKRPRKSSSTDAIKRFQTQRPDSTDVEEISLAESIAANISAEQEVKPKMEPPPISSPTTPAIALNYKNGRMNSLLDIVAGIHCYNI